MLGVMHSSYFALLEELFGPILCLDFRSRPYLEEHLESFVRGLWHDLWSSEAEMQKSFRALCLHL